MARAFSPVGSRVGFRPWTRELTWVPPDLLHNQTHEHLSVSLLAIGGAQIAAQKAGLALFMSTTSHSKKAGSKAVRDLLGESESLTRPSDGRCVQGTRNENCSIAISDVPAAAFRFRLYYFWRA